MMSDECGRAFNFVGDVKITNIVNGVVVNEGTRASVTGGRILLQSEGAEVYYRNVGLRPIHPH
jgi:hypothetical protein